MLMPTLILWLFYFVVSGSEGSFILEILFTTSARLAASRDIKRLLTAARSEH